MNHADTRSLRRIRLIALLLVLAPALVTVAIVRSADAQAPGSADLRLTKSDSPDPVKTSGKLTYTIAVRNAGPDTATNTMVTDRLPNEVKFISATASQGKCTVKQRKLTCTLGDVGFGAPYDERVLITVVVRAPGKAGSISNTAKVTSDTSDPNRKNDSDTEATTVRGGGQVMCKGAVATIVGTPGANVLRGTEGKDVIQARAGDDVIRGLAGRDLICAGSGNDAARGGSENDRVIGAGGNDVLGGQGGDDVLKGSRGRDALRGGRGDDALRGGTGNDSCHGGAGDDTTSSC